MDPKLGFNLYNLPGQSAKQKKKVPDKATDLIKLTDAQNKTNKNQTGVEYICGNCGKDVDLKLSDNVRCRYCGHRILYKKRTTAGMMYEAR
ncbi:unnamed protein product [Amoebophrya sp. A120]|nr:unnamed protein product [Amoebophrya sp. A120]|eukprot:GSA120T00006565001.1